MAKVTIGSVEPSPDEALPNPLYDRRSEMPRPYLDTSRPILLNQPTLYPYGPDTPADCRDTAGAQFAIDMKAEMDGISPAEAERQINAGCDDKADYTRPRFNEPYPFQASDDEG